MEGSVDEGSTKSDDEYDDLAMRDDLENGYRSGDEDKGSKVRYRQNLELFQQSNTHISSFSEEIVPRRRRSKSAQLYSRSSLQQASGELGSHGNLRGGLLS